MGRNTRSGSKLSTIRTTCARYRLVSDHQWNLDSPDRSA